MSAPSHCPHGISTDADCIDCEIEWLSLGLFPYSSKTIPKLISAIKGYPSIVKVNTGLIDMTHELFNLAQCLNDAIDTAIAQGDEHE